MRPPQPPAAESRQDAPDLRPGTRPGRKQAEAAARLDINTLKPGDVLEGRYKYIDRIGRGAFGTVLLMEDTVVDERLILSSSTPTSPGTRR